MTYRIQLDRDVCISSGRCVAEAPESFRFDDDEIVALVPGGPRLTDEQIFDLARDCPSGAIRVFDGDEEIDVY
ncbi:MULTISPECIES: ferredoxin [Nonomuraea]|uniref:Ferredoxin n=1 Tax=Nonomuraea ferruginea TaxID=46174 RepID=A0ABT4TDX7_9ACTN|nr:ferredoxin [Nonomuraea ferruginea]MDA0647580.1 ferredoxin [Nonomuraea ferruginea]